MWLYKKVILKNDKSFQKLSRKQKKNYLKIMKHKHLAYWLAFQFMYTVNCLICYFLLCLFNVLFCITAPKATAFVFFILTIPIILFILNVELKIFYMRGKEEKSKSEVAEWLYDWFLNFGLYNFRVINRDNWLFLKREHKDFYDFVRSDECNHRCYETTYKLAKKLKSRDLKILWLTVETPIEKVGHAVLERNGYIYDSNNRKTYSKKVYFKAFNVELYRSFSFKEYSSRKFLNAEFKVFANWCRERGVVPYDEDN